MRGISSKHRNEKCTHNFSPEKRCLGIDGRITLKWILKQ